jgi:glycolate oxidase iron-sulfur subunit
MKTIRTACIAVCASNQCPTYRLWGREADSPRGRIRQIELVDQGKLALGRCVCGAHRPVPGLPRLRDCRARRAWNTERFSSSARAQIEQHYKRPLGSRLASRFCLSRKLLPYRLADCHRGAAASSYTSVRGSRRLWLALREFCGCWDCRIANGCCRASIRSFSSRNLGKTFPAQGTRRARVALFAGCVAQVTFSELNRATIRVLQANGCEVVVPEGQVCCGALPNHAGVRDVARDLRASELRRISGGRVRRDHHERRRVRLNAQGITHLFTPEDARVSRKPRSSQQKMRDVTEFLAELGLTAPLRPVPLRVTYQDSCHLVHGQKIREAPRKLIRAVPGVELIEMPLADQCCGSAGVYNVTQPKAALDLLTDKMNHAKETKAQAILTANPGCILQLRAGAAIHNTGQEVLHVVELLDRALVKS